MKSLAKTLNDVRARVDPITRGGAKVFTVVYHPETMDEPMVSQTEFTEQELAQNGNYNLVEECLKDRLLSTFNEWRGR